MVIQMLIYECSQASIEHAQRCEDAILTFNGSGNSSAHAPVFAVIDGMGGHQHQAANGQLITGRDAAQLVRDVLIEDLEHLPPDVDAATGGLAEQRLTAAILRAHQRVYQELNGGDTLPARQRVGVVLTAAILCENGTRLLAMQVGDTRGYVYSTGELIQLCADEDNVEYLVRQHGLSEEDAARIGAILNDYDGLHEPKAEGVITLGGQEYDLYMAWRWFLNGNPALNIPAANVVINTVGIDQPDPVLEASRFEIAPGDILCLCSDGLYKNLSDQEITTLLPGRTDPAKALVRAAVARSQDANNRRQNPDDISAIVVGF